MSKVALTATTVDYQLQAVPRTQQGRQREPSVKALRPPFLLNSGGIAC